MRDNIAELEQVKQQRISDILSFSLGKIEPYLHQKEITEIMVNPDGKLWIDHLHAGRSCTKHIISCYDSERIIKIVANQAGTICNYENPILSAELREYKARFQGMLPPVVQKPCFTIRKHALKIFSLEDYIAQEILTEKQANQIKKSVQNKDNVIIAGGTSSGKTTLANAIFNEIAKTNDRLVILEDTQELQCNATDHIAMRVTDDVSMNDLLKSSMRLRPDRVIVGEVRDGAALTFLKSANTGHPGCMTTIHANGVQSTLIRLEQLIQEVVDNPPKHLIADAVDLVIYIEKVGSQRKVNQIGMVRGFDAQTSQYLIDLFDG